MANMFKAAFGSCIFIFSLVLGNASPRIFLTISPLVTRSEYNIIERQIEMNWESDESNINETSPWVGLFNHDPLEDVYDPLVRIGIKNATSGYQRTHIMFPKLEFQPENLTDDCLGYWIAYVVSNQTISSSCFRAQPFWMMELAPIIRNHSLDQLMIPGTHNAGSYQAFDPTRNSLLIRYLMTQDESIWNQLVYGNRYLDLRIAYHNSEFWITHSVFKTEILLITVLDEVRLFVNLTQEIVIVDFHRFETGFNGADALYRHRELISLLENHFGNILIPTSYGYDVLLDTLWKTNRRIYIGYANSARTESEYMFNGITHQWANADTLTGLEEYFNDTVCKQRKSNLISSMAHLTPRATGIVFDLYGGLRNMAQNINLIASKWFRERWWDCCNIVSTDYFHGSNMVNVAIESNRRRWENQ